MSAPRVGPPPDEVHPPGRAARRRGEGPRAARPRAEGPRAARRRAERRARRRPSWLLPAVLLLLVVAAASSALVVGGFVSRPDATPDPVVLPVPTPTVAPADRERSSAFQRALPDAVLAFAVAGQEEDLDLAERGAVEAYTLLYGDGEREVSLRAGQWASDEEAAAVAQELLPATALVRDEAVLVDGEEVGRVRIWGRDGDTAGAVWTNGGTLFALDGPGDVVPAFYDAFPM